jgi:hypothetical protein
MTVRGTWAALWCLAAALGAPSAHAHASSDSYLSLEVHGASITGRWDIALRDLDTVLMLDADADGQLTWGEIRTREADLEAYVLDRLALSAQGSPCTLRGGPPMLERNADGTYVVLMLDGGCGQAANDLAVTYSLLFENDTTHRGLLKLRLGTSNRTAVFAPDSRTQRFRAHTTSWLADLTGFAASGVRHILDGYDHLLFLLSLLLPAVAVRRPGGWEPAASMRPVVTDVVRTVTAFTLAHSLTFLLAGFGRVELPTRLVETAIAASVVIAALNNVFTVVDSRRWIAAFAFGLVHGLGFAGLLGGLELPSGAARALPLLAFNVGVELGQLAIVALTLPVLFMVRSTAFYRRAVLVGGSCAIALIGAAWFVERAFDWPMRGPS